MGTTRASVEEEPAAVERLSRYVAGWGLADGGPPPGPIDPILASSLVAVSKTAGLLGPLMACVDGGGLKLPEEAVKAAIHEHEAAQWWCLQVEQMLAEVDRWFEAVGGVRYRVLKGTAVAHLDDVDPALRSFGDLDLLVAAPDMDRALGVLADHGGNRVFPARRPGFDRRFAKGTGQILFGRVEIDVHRTLADGGFGYRIPAERLFADPEAFQVADRKVLALYRPARALHACYHAVATTKPPSLRTIRDLGWYLSDPDLQPDVLVPEIRRWGAEVVLAEAVRLTVVTLGLRLEAWERWADTLVVSPREQVLLERCRRYSARPVEWSTLREIPWQDRAAFLYAVAVPSREVLASRRQTHLSRLVSGTRNLVAASRR